MKKKIKKIYYNKLIRDKIPLRIEESKGKYLIRILKAEDFKKELVKKITEEAAGVTQARSKGELVSEIGDLLDVIDEVKKAYRISSEEVKVSRKEEMEKKGGFKKRIYLVWSENTGYKSNERKK